MIRFYHVIAFPNRVSLGGYPVGGYYLGKTSDVAFKTEVDKSLDLDDGSTEVGSEKLHFSCSLLGRLNDRAVIREIWLIPVVDNYLAMNPSVVRIQVEDEEYYLEEKSGEFGKVNLKAEIRYPVGYPQWWSIDYWDAQDKCIIIGQMSGDYDGAEVFLNDDGLNQLASVDCASMIMRGAYAFVGVPSGYEYVLMCGNGSAGLDASEATGLARVDFEVVE